MDDEERYTIKRSYRDGRPAEVIETGLTLDEAKHHCNDPITRKDGEWFDFYVAE
jgi:hypothetical protein